MAPDNDFIEGGSRFQDFDGLWFWLILDDQAVRV